MHLRLLLAFFAVVPSLVSATHIRAGEIIVRTAGCENSSDQLTGCATIITYTENAQTEVDRDSLLLNWGDGSNEMIGRTRITQVAPGVQRNEYSLCHRYAAFGRYVLSFQDVNRVRNIRNIGAPSVNIPFSVFTSFYLTNPITGCNSSPELTQDPIDNTCIGSVWTHNPGAFDVDGDSLAFEFTTPSFAPRSTIPSYVLPNEINGASGSLEIDPRTGQITWDNPTIPGEYNLTFLVKSFRNGIPLDTLVRDMEIFVDDCVNEPPVIELALEKIDVVAGGVVAFDVLATGSLSEDETVTLTASGRPFNLADNPATFLPKGTGKRFDPLRKTFRWTTTPADISNQEYFVVVRAEDNGPPLPTGLATLRTISIKVVAPPPTATTPSMFSPGYVWIQGGGYPWFSRTTVRRYRISQEPTDLEGQRYYRVETSSVEPSDTVWTPLDGAFLRQGEGKVYVHAPGRDEDNNLDNDVLLYDFTLQVGDTFNVPRFSPLDWWLPGAETVVKKAVVTVVDSVTLDNGERRKRLTLGCLHPGTGSTINKYYWIEGMGSTDGMFESTFICAADIHGPLLLCYSLNGETLYRTQASCKESPVSTKSPKSGIHRIQLYPNPTTGILTIDRVATPYAVRVYDLTGRAVQDRSKMASNQIDLSALRSGVYILEVTETSGTRSIARVVKR